MFDGGSRLIVALDVPSAREAEALVESIAPAKPWVKIGLELFVAEGPAFVRRIADSGVRVMLDLKLHDIPATVARAVSRAKDLGVELLTVHAAGGREMLTAASEAAAQASGDASSGLALLAVTVLTSMDECDLNEVVPNQNVKTQVERLAELAVSSGCQGIVCSPLEAKALRARLPADTLIVTPGVRPAGADAGDQKRVTTPTIAIEYGASAIVVGRPIRDAESPLAVAEQISKELTDAANR